MLRGARFVGALWCSGGWWVVVGGGGWWVEPTDCIEHTGGKKNFPHGMLGTSGLVSSGLGSAGLGWAGLIWGGLVWAGLG